MVRETRHLWVGNLPENIREERVRDHFKRYGRVQSVKLLPRSKDEEGGCGSGCCATVSFMDIKSAAKAHDTEHKLEDCLLTTEYHEPAAIPSSGQPLPHPLPAALYTSSRFQHGATEEIASFERSSHFYERRESEAYLRRSTSTYHVSPPDTLRGRTRDRLYRNGPYTPIIESVVSRSHRPSWSSYDGPTRYPSTPATPDISYQDERREPSSVVVLHNKLSKSSRSGSHGSESGSSGSRSRSSSSSSHSGSSSCSSPSSSHSDKSTAGLQSTVAQSSLTRPTAICVRNLPARSSDTSLKDGLFHEYKKYGKVTCVKVVGSGADRYGVVVFKKADDVEKALQISHDKLFFGCKIDVAPYHGQNVDDNEFRPYEAELDEYHPKATRTLFIGNLEKDITANELQKHFKQFGEIIEIDIKKQGSGSVYAFVQYCDIVSVVRAMRAMDGEYLGHTRINLGYGKSLATACVWLDGIAETVSEKYLSVQFSQFGPVSHVAIDRSRGHALVFFQQILFAQLAVNQMRGVVLRGRKLQVDFASRECQEAFYEHLEKFNVYENSTGTSPQHSSGSVRGGFETPSSSGSSGGKPSSRHVVSSRYPRHLPTSRFDFSDYPNDMKACSIRSYEDIVDDAPSDPLVTVMVGPPDIRHLQKERHALLEQLEDCPSSGEEGSSRRRCRHHRSQSGEGSRPGTPLCDERPENLLPVEPRKTPRDKPGDPLSLPLPRFASQVFSPRPTPPSPPASPPRPDSSSSDSQPPPSPEWEERLKSLDEKYEKWSGSRTATAKVDSSSLRIRHKLLDLDVHELQPSEIVKSVLARRSVFDEDSKRLENFREKYEPKEFVPAPTRPNFQSIRTRLDISSPLPSPSHSIPKSPASSPAPAKGLQYPFPSHPPVLPTTAVTTSGTSVAAITTPSSPVSDYGCTRFEPVSARSIEEEIGKRRSRDDESVLKWLNHSERKSSIGESIPAIAHVDPRKLMMEQRRARESTDSKESVNLKEVEFRESVADRLRDLDDLKISSHHAKPKLENNPRADSRLPTLDHSNVDSSSKPKSIESLDRKIDCFSSSLDKRDAVSVDPRLEKRDLFPTDPRLERSQTCSNVTYDYTTCSTKVPDFLGKRYELKLDRDDQIQMHDNHKNVPDSKDRVEDNSHLSSNLRHQDSKSAIEMISTDNSGKDNLDKVEKNIEESISPNQPPVGLSCSVISEEDKMDTQDIEIDRPKYECISDTELSLKEEIQQLQKDMELSDEEMDIEHEKIMSPVEDSKPPVLSPVLAEMISPNLEIQRSENNSIDESEDDTKPPVIESNEIIPPIKSPIKEVSDCVEIKMEVDSDKDSGSNTVTNEETKDAVVELVCDKIVKTEASTSPKTSHCENIKEKSENKPKEEKTINKSGDIDSKISSKSSDVDSPEMPDLKSCVEFVDKVDKEHKSKEVSREKHRDACTESRHKEKETRVDKSDSKHKDSDKSDSKRKDSVSEKIDLKSDSKHSSSKRRDSFSSEKSDHRHRSQSSDHKAKDSEKSEARRKDSFSEKSEHKIKDICDKNVHKTHDSIPEKTDKRHENTEKSSLKSHDSGDKHVSKSHDSSDRKHKDSSEKSAQLNKQKDSSLDKTSSKHKESSHEKSESRRRNSNCDKKDVKQRRNCENRTSESSSGKVEETKTSECSERKRSDETKKDSDSSSSSSKPHHNNAQTKKSDELESTKSKKEKEKERDSDKEHSIKKSKSNFSAHSPEHKEDTLARKYDSSEKLKKIDHSESSVIKTNKSVDRHKSMKDHVSTSVSCEKEKDKKKEKDSVSSANNSSSKQKSSQSTTSINKHSKEVKETKDKEPKRKDSVSSSSSKQGKDSESSEHKEINSVHNSTKNHDSKKELSLSDTIKKDIEKKKKSDPVDHISKIKEIFKAKEHENPDNGRHKDKIKTWDHISVKLKDNNRIKNNQLNDSVYEERKKDFFDGLYKNDIDCNNIYEVNHVKEITREPCLSLKETSKDHETSKHKSSDKKRESCDRDRRKDDEHLTNNIDFKSKDMECSSKNKSKRNKESDNFEKRKEREPSVDNIYDEKRSESIKKERRKERSSTSSLPATIGSKRRISSQDSLDGSDDKVKPERRDSKDSSRSYGSSKKGDKHNRVSKSFDEKVKEDEERSKKKEFSEDRRPKSINRKESSGSSSSCSEKIKDPFGNNSEKFKEKELNEKRKEPSNMEKMQDYSSSCEKLNKDKKSKQRTDSGNTCSESELGSGDDDKKRQHSIFDIVDDEPAYISMYDKVKARSCKNMQKQKEERKQERLKEKFNQLKQSRAKREEKKRSTSYDEDSDSERGIGRRSSKLMITSSEEDNVSEYDTKHKARKITSESEDDIIRRQSFSSRNKNSRIQSEESDIDNSKIFEDKNVASERENFSDHYANENSVDEKPNANTNYDSTCPSNDDTSFSRSVMKKKSHKKKQKRQRSLDNDDNSSKKHSSKKHRRKFSHESEEKSTNKVRHKKLNAANFYKKEDSMEDIFGPLSEDSSDKNQYERKWQVTQVYGTDSESEKEAMNKREKRRKERNKELKEMGDAVEAGLLESCTSPPPEPAKIKKKKRKKSKEEKSKHSKERDSESITPVSPPIHQSSPPPLVPMVSHNKKLDIPGFGSKVDENIHETAVKSISEAQEPIMKEETAKPSTCPSPAEEKPTIIISQEETEDAVAALLEDAFGGGGGFDDTASYTDEPSKPETPVSDNGLRIDTDTEDSFFDDLYKPPKTPDAPPSCQLPSSREGLEERIAAMASNKDKGKDNVDEEMPEVKPEASLPVRTDKEESKTGTAVKASDTPFDPFDLIKTETSEQKLKTEPEELKDKRKVPINDRKPQIFEDSLMENDILEQGSKEEKIMTSKIEPTHRFGDSNPELKKEDSKLMEVDDLSFNDSLLGKAPKYRYPPKVNSQCPPKHLSTPLNEIGLASHLPGPLSININDNAMKTSPSISPSTPLHFQTSLESSVSPKSVEKSLNMPTIDGPISGVTIPSKTYSVLSPNQKLAAFNDHSPKSSVSPGLKSPFKFIPSTPSPTPETSNLLSPTFNAKHPTILSQGPAVSHMKITSVVSPSFTGSVTPPAASCLKPALSPVTANFTRATPSVGIASQALVSKSGHTAIVSHTVAATSPVVTSSIAPASPSLTPLHSTVQSHAISQPTSVVHSPPVPPVTSSHHVSANRGVTGGLLTTVGYTGTPSHPATVPHTVVTSHTSAPSHPPSMNRPVSNLGPSRSVYPGPDKFPGHLVSTTVASAGTSGTPIHQQKVNQMHVTSPSSHIPPSVLSLVKPAVTTVALTSVKPTVVNTPHLFSYAPPLTTQGLVTTGTPVMTTSVTKTKSPVAVTVPSHAAHLSYQPSSKPPSNVPSTTSVVSHPNAPIFTSYPGSVPLSPAHVSPKPLQQPLSLSTHHDYQPTPRVPVTSVISSATKPQLGSNLIVSNPSAQLKGTPFIHSYQKPGAKYLYNSTDQIQNLSGKLDKKVEIAAYQVTDLSDKFHVGQSKQDYQNESFLSKDLPSPPSFMKHDMFNNQFSMKETPAFNIQNCIDTVKSSLNEECLKPINLEVPSLSKTSPETDKFAPKTDIKSPPAIDSKKTPPVENHLDDKENVSTTKNEPNWLKELMNRSTSSTEASVKNEEVLKESKLSQIVSEMESRLNEELEAKRQKQSSSAEDVEKTDNKVNSPDSSNCSNVSPTVTAAASVASPTIVTSPSTAKPTVVDTNSPSKASVVTSTPTSDSASASSTPTTAPSTESTAPTAVSTADTKNVEPKVMTRKDAAKEASVPPVIIRMEESGSTIVSPSESKKAKEGAVKSSAKTENKEEAADQKEESNKSLTDTPNTRRGRRRRVAGGGGGRVMTRRAKLQGVVEENEKAAPEPADVYEFKDDSDEEVGQQPRLILTIKSPPENQAAVSTAATSPSTTATLTTTTVTTAAVTTTAAVVVTTTAAPVVTTALTTTPSSTRKSRRLQEKDGSRNNVDDTIDEVVRGLRSGAANTRRSARTQNAAPTLAALPDSMRRSPRRKQTQQPPATPCTTETPAPPPPSVPPTPAAPAVPAVPAAAEVPLPSPPSPAVPSPAQVPPSSPAEPAVLIDPVTGLLIPMQESEEGQYVPVASDLNRLSADTNDNDEPPEKRARASSPRPCVAVAPNNAITSPTKPQLPVGLVKPNPAAVVSPSSSLLKPCSVSPSGLSKPNTPSPALPHVAKVGPQTTVATALTPPIIVKAPVSLCAAPPLNHKAHLLQAVANQAKTPVPMTPKAHILQSISAMEGGRTTPHHNGPMLTASMASPPLKTPAAPASTRIESGCIVVANPPAAQPPRSAQVMQAGLPVPAYEASLGEVQHMSYMQPPHYVHPQLVYQQYLREAALSYHMTPGSEVEDAGASPPPLELRRATDSPAVATLYVPRHLYYDGPPPAHRPSQPRLQVATPPHASQVPPQADSLLILLQRYPVMWQGLLALKNDQAAVQMHFVWGHPRVATDSLPCNSDGTTPPLRIAQRMRLEQTQLDGVARKMQIDNEHCMLLALPCGRDHLDVLQQSNNLRAGFITYLQQKQAAGIVNIAAPGSHQPAYVVHIFPSCEFANDSLARIAPDLLHRVADIAHLLIVIATV